MAPKTQSITNTISNLLIVSEKHCVQAQVPG